VRNIVMETTTFLAMDCDKMKPTREGS